MEKLLTMCTLFHTDLDTLLRGDARNTSQVDAAGYERHMNCFSNYTALGIGLFPLSVAAGMALYGFGGLSQNWLTGTLISGAAVATALLIIAGIRHSCFEKEHPLLQDFYTQKQRQQFMNRYPFLIAISTLLFFAAVLLLMLGQYAILSGSQANARLLAIFLCITGIGVTLLTWTVLRKSKFDIAAWNKQHDPSPDAAVRRRKAGRIFSITMYTATVLYLLIGCGAMMAGSPLGWCWGWMVYPSFGIVCLLATYHYSTEES